MLLSSLPQLLERARSAVASATNGGSETTHVLKVAAIGGCVLTAFVTVLALLDPSSAVRRSASDYVRKLDERLHVLRKEPRGARVLAMQMVLIALVIVVAAQLGKPVLLILAAVVAAAPPLYLDGAVAKRRATIEGQVHGFALNLSSTMRTTANIGDSIRVASKIAGGPLGEEVEVLLAQMGFGSSLDDALEDLARRGNVLALDVLVTALLMARKTGGDVPMLMETTAASLREIHRLEALAAKLMTEPKRAFAMMALAPPLGFFGMKQLLPMIFDRFVDTENGHRVLLICIIGYVVCLLMGWKFVKVAI